MRYDGSGGYESATSMVTNVNGSKVVVTGYSGDSGSEDYATVVYSALTGGLVGVARYNGSGNARDDAWSSAANANDSAIFITGGSTGTQGTEDYVTIAYATGTGAVLWTSVYDGPGAGTDTAWAVVPSPDGSKVFVTGQSKGVAGTDFATIAYEV
jgi:hypothetical protein